MAESDAGPRATGAVSTEEAERLSERFRPSWEDDPPTIPREPMVPAAAAKPVPAPIIAVPFVAPKAAADDLDWELPTNPLPEAAPTEPTLTPAAGSPYASAADSSQTQKLPAVIPAAARPPEPAPELEVQVDVEEVPPSSKPSGIGEKYVPKEEGAPPVVLHEELRKAEVGAQAAIEAQHRARRAPTIARMKVADLIPSPPEVEEEVPFAPPRRRGYGGLVALGVTVLGIAALGTVLLGRGKTTEGVPPPATTPATVAPDTAAPPPPPPVVADTVAPAPPEPAAASAAAPGASSAVATAPSAKSSPSESPKTPATKATATPRAVTAGSRPASPKATTAARPAPPPP
ncbi:MAG TPA: hypothetical protein VGQ57_08585, partial [Polyangiaceae bacterium]|nr:hypothetical protein [Polyangiaceae bacterium]